MTQEKNCANCRYWYNGRNGGYSPTMKRGWAECRAIMDGCLSIEVKFFDRDWSDFYVETQDDFYCSLWKDENDNANTLAD